MCDGCLIGWIRFVLHHKVDFIIRWNSAYWVTRQMVVHRQYSIGEELEKVCPSDKEGRTWIELELGLHNEVAAKLQAALRREQKLIEAQVKPSICPARSPSE